ncbi:uncharacterized protein KIAA1614 homolog isoform X6 [Perognathus longimembris pacificus]|uniref:uncharacterized protein KIAA1614 homolog isoform X6 n=1 Tax=Perognathus longimembris pacificus TaxID=214514 RepID=UPI002018C120|nr:uncharacterized protein KIAA1614 homolog isoform X6 [Perognathus longimembris pacificus]
MAREGAPPAFPSSTQSSALPLQAAHIALPRSRPRVGQARGEACGPHSHPPGSRAGSPSPKSSAGPRGEGWRTASPLRGMEGMEAEAARHSPPKSKPWSRTASPMQVTSAVPQLDNGALPRPWPCPQEDRTPTWMSPQPPRTQELQKPSVLESKVRALKEMTANKQGDSPCPLSHECSSPKKSKCPQGKARGVQSLPEGSPLPDAVLVPHAENPSDGQLDSSVNENQPTRNGVLRPSRSLTPGLECQNGQSPWPPEAVWMLCEHEKSLLSGPSSLQESLIHRTTPAQPEGSSPCKVSCIPNLTKGRVHHLEDHLSMALDLDSTPLTSEKDLNLRTVPQGTLWRAGELQALGPGDNALSLSDQVEKNRLLLQEMLKVSGQSCPKVATPAWTPSLDGSISERPAGDRDWDSGRSPQDSDLNRTFGSKPEPVLSAKHKEAKHLLQHARMKAKTRPLRASHDLVPTVAQGIRDDLRSPAQDPRVTCSDGLQNGTVSDSSSEASSGGQGPRRGSPVSHVRFEDESANEAEVRYLERLQQRQRRALSTVLQKVGQGPLRSKPDLAHYVRRDLDVTHHPGPPPVWDSDRKCPACGSCLQEGHSAEAKAASNLRRPQGVQVAEGVQGMLPEPPNSHGLSSPFSFIPAQPGIHTEWIRETHIGDTATCPEEGDCALDSKEVGTSQLSRTGGLSQSNSPRQQSHRWPRKVKMELPWDLQAQPHLPEIDDVEKGDEVEGERGHTLKGTEFLREDAVSKPPVLKPQKASLGSERPKPQLGNHRTNPVDQTPCKTACATRTLSMNLGPSGPGRPDQGTESHKSLEIVSASSLSQSHTQSSAPLPAQQLTAFLSPEGWMPTPPPPRKTTCPVSHRKSALAGPRRPRGQAQPVDLTLSQSPPGTVVLSLTQAQACRPQVKHPRLDPSTNNHLPQPQKTAVHKSRAERSPCSQDPQLPLESSVNGLQGAPGSDVATINSTGITLSLSLAPEEPASSQELEGVLQRLEPSSGGHVPPGTPPGARAESRPPSAVPSDGKKKRSNSIVSALGLKKLFSALGHTSQPKIGRARSHSMEQLQPMAPGPVSHTSTPKVKRVPSLQSLHLVSPSHKHHKTPSFQNFHSLLSSKGDRSSVYLVEESGDPNTPVRSAKGPPRRTLSVEDVGAPSLARTVGRVAEVFPDGTNQLQLQRPREGTFGFCVAYGNGHGDSGLYVQEMADLDTAKLYSGLLGVGDEILEVNGAKVAGLGLAHIKELLAHSESLSIRVLRHRPGPR